MVTVSPLAATNRVEAHHGKSNTVHGRCAACAPIAQSYLVNAGHAFVQNLRRGDYERGLDVPPGRRVAAAFTELAPAI